MREPTPQEPTHDETGHEKTGTLPLDGTSDGKQRSARKLIRELDGPVDDDFRQSMSGLSQRLAERVAGQSTVDPKAAVAARKAALQAYDVERAQRLRAILRITGAGALSVAIAAIVVIVASPFDQPTLGPSTFAKPMEVAAVPPVAAPPVAEPTASAVPSPKAPPVRTPAGSTTPIPIAPATTQTATLSSPAAPTTTQTAPLPPPAAPVTVQATASASPTAPATAQAATPPSSIVETAAVPSDLEPPPLHQNEVREVQSRLRSFGFNPGPIDGVAGTMTQMAVTGYQQSRDLQQTGLLDRELLEQLRRDPAPEVAPPPVQRAARPNRPQRSQDPFRAIGQDFERWLRSL